MKDAHFAQCYIARILYDGPNSGTEFRARPRLAAGYGIRQAKLPGNQHPLDLGRSLADLQDLRVPEMAGHRELLDVAVAPVDLDRLPGTLHRHLGGEQLRHRRHRLVAPPLLAKPRRLVDLVPGCGDLRGHISQLELHRLVGADLPAERRALAGVPQALVETSLGEAHREGADRDPAPV